MYSSYSQTKFTVNESNFYTLKDTIKNIVYSFDSGSDHSNLFDKEKFDKKFGGFSIIQNGSGKFKLIKKARIKEKVIGLGSINTNANVLTNKELTNKYCLSIDLLFGTRIMKQHKLHFDNKSSTLKSLNELPPDISGYIKLELKYNIFDHRYYTVFDINGRKEKFLIDTAYSGQILVKSDKNLAKKIDTYSSYMFFAFEAKEIKMNKYVNNSIVHNNIRFKNDVVYSYESHSANVIGNAFFLNFEDVIFDLKNKNIYLRNEMKRFDPFTYDILFSAHDDGTIKIGYLKNSSKYYDQGFRVGDTILLEDKELEHQLIHSPCETLSILNNWKAVNGPLFIFSKSS